MDINGEPETTPQAQAEQLQALIRSHQAQMAKIMEELKAERTKNAELVAKIASPTDGRNNLAHQVQGGQSHVPDLRIV